MSHLCPICGQDLTCPVCFGRGVVVETAPFFSLCSCAAYVSPPECPSCVSQAQDAMDDECREYFSTRRPCPDCRGQGFNADACGA